MQEIPPDALMSLSPLLSGLPLDTLLARSVLRGDVDGRVWSDSADCPRWLYVRHPYGMSMIAGDIGEADIAPLAALLDEPRERDEWLQVWPAAQAEALIGRLAPQRCERHTRSNFRFDREAHARLRRTLTPPAGVRIERMGEELFARLPLSVSPQAFWRDAAQFARQGLGFCTFIGAQATASAFAAHLFDGELEIGIETLPAWRGQGHALWVASALIEEGLARQLTPVWSCRRENSASWRLAQKLGFLPTLELPYFRLRA